jgi:hypothetical protein
MINATSVISEVSVLLNIRISKCYFWLHTLPHTQSKKRRKNRERKGGKKRKEKRRKQEKIKK